MGQGDDKMTCLLSLTYSQGGKNKRIKGTQNLQRHVKTLR